MELKDTVDGMLSDDYIERFKAEYRQLIIRITKLYSIIEKAKINNLGFQLSSKVEQLDKQLDIMLRYASILRERAATEGINLD